MPLSSWRRKDLHLVSSAGGTGPVQAQDDTQPHSYNLARLRIVRWLPTGGVAIQEVDTKRLGQVAARYLGNLAAGQRELAASEINRFVRHIGPERPVTQITTLEVERYQNYLPDSVGDADT